MNYVKAHIPGGQTAQAEQLANAELTRFFEQPFFATSWYDVWPLVLAGHACGALVNTGYEDFVRTRAQHQVECDLNLVRRVLIRTLSPEALAVRVPAMNASYFDFVGVHAQTEAGGVGGVCSGLPKPLVRWYQLVTETFIAEILNRRGMRGRGFEIHWDPAVGTGRNHGVPVFDVPYRVLFHNKDERLGLTL